jgi:hypothetical protein
MLERNEQSPKSLIPCEKLALPFIRIQSQNRAPHDQHANKILSIKSVRAAPRGRSPRRPTAGGSIVDIPLEMNTRLKRWGQPQLHEFRGRQ